MNRSFFRGFLLSLCCVCFYQDWLGQHAYMDAVAEHWVPIHWWVWPPIIAVLVLGEIGARMMESERQKSQN